MSDEIDIELTKKLFSDKDHTKEDEWPITPFIRLKEENQTSKLNNEQRIEIGVKTTF